MRTRWDDVEILRAIDALQAQLGGGPVSASGREVMNEIAGSWVTDPALISGFAHELDLACAGSSWINQVERWFGYLTDQMIRRGVHKSVQALESDIRAWIENWNQDPRPFTWAKTAEEILDSLARYIARISGAGHQRGSASDRRG